MKKDVKNAALAEILSVKNLFSMKIGSDTCIRIKDLVSGMYIRRSGYHSVFRVWRTTENVILKPYNLQTREVYGDRVKVGLNSHEIVHLVQR